MKKIQKKSALALILLMILVVSACQSEDIPKTDPTPGSASVNIVVKFAQGSDVRLREGKLVSLSEGAIPELDAVLDDFDISNIERLFSQPEEEIAEEYQQLIVKSSDDVPDLNLYFMLAVADDRQAQDLIKELNRLELVEFSEYSPEPAPPPADLP